MLRAVAEKLRTLHGWMVKPMVAANSVKRGLIFRVLRSRLIWLVALLTAVPQLSAAIGYTWKATHPTEERTLWLLWALVVLGWIYFILVLFVGWRDLHERLGGKSR